MRTGLQLVDLDDLVDRPLLVVLATRRSNGDVLLSPQWHEWRDGGFKSRASAHALGTLSQGRPRPSWGL
jgi:hypothetical protein